MKRLRNIGLGSDRIKAKKHPAKNRVVVVATNPDAPQKEVDAYSRHWLGSAGLQGQFDDKRKPWHKQRAKIVLDNIGPGSVLDVACATGELTKMISELPAVARVVGYDGGQELVDYAKEHHSGIEFVCGFVESMPFEANGFNWVHAGEIIEHIENPHTFVRNVAVIAESGAIFSTPKDIVNDPGHICIFTKEALQEVCLANFNDVTVFDGGRTWVAVCKHSRANTILWAADIQARHKGDFAQTMHLCKALVSAGYTVDLTHRAKGSTFTPAHVKGVNLLPMSDPIRDIGAFCQGRGYTVAIARGPHMFAALNGVICTVIPYVYGGHFADKRTDLLKAALSAKKVIVQGAGQLEHAAAFVGDTTHITPVPIAVDDVSINGDAFIIGYVGSLFNFQGVDSLIDIVAGLRDNGDDFRLSVVGVETQRGNIGFYNNLRDRLKSINWVFWLGGVGQENLLTMYKGFDVFVSFYDNNRMNAEFRDVATSLIKTKVAEAAVAGVPIVCDRSWGNEFLLGKKYPYFADTLGEVASAIEYIKAHMPDARADARAAMLRVKGLCGKAVIGQQLKGLIDA